MSVSSSVHLLTLFPFRFGVDLTSITFSDRSSKTSFVRHLERNERVTRHRSHEYKQPNRVNTHARIKHILSVCPNAQNIADQTREQKKCFKMFYRMFDRVQILPNTLKHVETCLNSTKQGGQTEKCFANQQCFSMFYRKTFTVWTGLKTRTYKWYSSRLM